jgi:hypothetical protein
MVSANQPITERDSFYEKYSTKSRGKTDVAEKEKNRCGSTCFLCVPGMGDNFLVKVRYSVVAESVSKTKTAVYDIVRTAV